MRCLQQILLLAGVVAFSGCATPPLPHTEVALTARVSERQQVSATLGGLGSSGIYRPGTGGAVGGLVAGLLRGSSGTPAYWGYTFKVSDGSTRYASSRDEYQVGDCVSVYSVPAKAKDSYWLLAEITITPATGCE